MHVGGLMLFAFPENAGPAHIRRLAEHLREYTKAVPPYSLRLTHKLGKYYWVEDRQFDLEHHFRHEALPKPGRVRELLASVSAEHSNLMDRARPLWECHLIEGLRGKRFALYTKLHHSISDGVSAMRMLESALSEDPDLRESPPFWAKPSTKNSADKSTAKQQKQPPGSFTLIKQASDQMRSIPGTFKALRQALLLAGEKQILSSADHIMPFQAPQSMFNQVITGSRRFAAQSYPMARLKRLAKTCQATLNDIVLAISSSAIRDYLISQNALPDLPLIALVPVSIREPGQRVGGNKVAGILANLGTHIADPAYRLQVIKSSVEQGKQRYASMSNSEILNYTAIKLFPAMLHMATGVLPKWQMFNVVISNVPGPKQPLYWNGAKLLGTYPISIPVNQMALNITTVSYVDQMEFGLTACRRTLPSMQRLLDFIEVGIKDLELAAGITA